MRRALAGRHLVLAIALGGLLGAAPAKAASSTVPGEARALIPTVPVLGACSGIPFSEPSDYYAIDLVPTGRVPGTGLATGVAYQTAAASPFFGVALAPTGEYLFDLDIRIEGIGPPRTGAYVAWATDTDVAEIVRLGTFDESFRVRGQVAWNKFLVVITREPTETPGETWEGPIVMRGMSRSGRMHTLAGHGPFQAEPCAKYGFR